MIRYAFHLLCCLGLLLCGQALLLAEATPKLECLRITMPKAIAWTAQSKGQSSKKYAALEVCLSRDMTTNSWHAAFAHSPQAARKSGQVRLNTARYLIDHSQLQATADRLSGSLGLTIQPEKTLAPPNLQKPWTGVITLTATKKGGNWEGTFALDIQTDCKAKGKTSGKAIIIAEQPHAPTDHLQFSMILEEALGPIRNHPGTPVRAIIDLPLENGNFGKGRTHVRYQAHHEHTVHDTKLTFTGQRLHGTIVLKTTAKHRIYAGTYTLEIDCQVIGSVFSGSLQGHRVWPGEGRRSPDPVNYPGHVSGIILPAAQCTDERWWSLGPEPRKGKKGK